VVVNRLEHIWLCDGHAKAKYNFGTQIYWNFGLSPLSSVLGSRNTFRKLDLFPSSGEGGRRHQLSWVQEWKQIQFPSFYSQEHQMMEKVQNPVILCAIHHRQNPLKSIYNSGSLTLHHLEKSGRLQYFTCTWQLLKEHTKCLNLIKQTFWKISLVLYHQLFYISLHILVTFII
jgi:hypothetical protein